MTAATGAEVRFQADTLMRGFERDTSAGSNQAVVPGYLYLQGAVGALDDAGVSLHFYGWGRNDFADNGYYSETSTAELLYGYLQYRDEGGRKLRLGRFTVFSGVANDAVDGLQISSPLGNYFSVDGYLGQPVGLADTDGRGGDLIYGGRIGHHFGSLYDVGLSYQLEENDSATAEEWAAVDLALFPADWASIYGSARYSLEVEDWAEQSLRVDLGSGAWHLVPVFEAYQYDAALDLGANSVNPFRVLAQSGEELTSYGAGLSRYGESFDFNLDFRHYDYQIADASDFASVDLSWRGEGRTRVGGELALMQSDTATNDYQLFRIYAYFANRPLAGLFHFVSGELQLVEYDQAIRNETTALFASLGCGWSLMQERLEIKVSGDYASDPYYDEDTRGMLTLTWRYPGVL